MEENVKFYYCHSIEWCILVESVRETEKNAKFPGSVGHICQMNAFNVQISDCACVVLFSKTFQRL